MKKGAVLLLGGFAVSAHANAVMGVALEQYDPTAWLFYVVLTVLYEAWAIGRKAGFSRRFSLGVSFLANFVTAFCCANIGGVALHGPIVGSSLNPNPLLNMVAIFAGFAVISGLIEGTVWFFCDRRGEARWHDTKWLGLSLKAHLIWVPIGVAIMLVPNRPYPFLEGYTVQARYWYVQRLATVLEGEIAEEGRIPDGRDVPKLLAHLAKSRPHDSNSWAAAYRPHFGRFTSGEDGGDPLWQWNPRATGLKVDSDRTTDAIWLLRTQDPWGQARGLYYKAGRVSVTVSREMLGYGKAPDPSDPPEP